MSPPVVAWIVFGAFVVASLIVAAVGAVRCVKAMRGLSRHTERYKDLPIARAFASTQRRLEETRAHLAEAGTLVEQARATLASTQASLGELLAGLGVAVALFARAADDVRVVRSTFWRGSTGT
jgi:hypothetical protein